MIDLTMGDGEAMSEVMVLGSPDTWIWLAVLVGAGLTVAGQRGGIMKVIREPSETEWVCECDCGTVFVAEHSDRRTRKYTHLPESLEFFSCPRCNHPCDGIAQDKVQGEHDD